MPPRTASSTDKNARICRGAFGVVERWPRPTVGVWLGRCARAMVTRCVSVVAVGLYVASMDAGVGWAAVGTVAALVLGVPSLVIAWLDRRDRRGDRGIVAGGDVGLSAGGVSPPWGRLPRSGLRGRDEVVRRLRRSLRHRPGRVQVVAGLGGVGKSAVALAVCSWSRGRWRRRRSVWWVSAADRASLTAGMIGVARQVGGGEDDLRAIGAGVPDAPERLWALLERARRGWLLVVDNADELDLLGVPAPSGNPTGGGTVADGTGWVRPTRRGLVVVTSRVADPGLWGASQVDVHRLDVLGVEEASAVLLDLAVGGRGERRPGPASGGGFADERAGGGPAAGGSPRGVTAGVAPGRQRDRLALLLVVVVRRLPTCILMLSVSPCWTRTRIHRCPPTLG